MSDEQQWFKEAQGTSVYYSYETENDDIHTYEVIGNGITIPTPGEIKAYLHKLQADKSQNYFQILAHTSGSIVCVGYSAQIDEQKVILPPGTYNYKPSGMSTPERLLATKNRTDSHVPLEKQYAPIVSAVNEFLNSHEVYKQINVLYKRGFLLYGPAGTGKTSGLRTIIANHLPQDAVVITLDTIMSDEFILFLKKTLSNRLKVFIIEELANVCNRSDLIERTLTFLDGENSLNNSIIFATTNYPEKLEANIVDRPSRFDAIFKIGTPDQQEREVLMKFFLQREVTIDEVTNCKDMTTAQIKEVCILSQIKKISVIECANKMRAHSKLVQKEFMDTKGSMGFHNE